MSQRIFVAGAAGVIGRRLVPQLRAAGHQVFGTTRSHARADELRLVGAEPVVVDVFDAQALTQAVVDARPDVVIHQLTDLPPHLDPDRMAEAVIGNARIRDEGTRNLVDAAIIGGARRMVTQSIAWAYASAAAPHGESDPLDIAAEGGRATTINGIVALENYTLQSPPLQGIVLRYGHLYGPGTGTSLDAEPAVHVDAAAHAALLAIERGRAPGIYNVAEPCTQVSSEKAIHDLGWNPEFRLDERIADAGLAGWHPTL